jgi:hypothetical protein
MKTYKKVAFFKKKNTLTHTQKAVGKKQQHEKKLKS